MTSLTFSLNVEPTGAEVALEVLGHIEAAIRALAKAAMPAKVEKQTGGLSPETIAELKKAAQPKVAAPAPVQDEEPEPEPEPKKPAKKKTAAKKTAKPKADELDADDLAEMDGDRLLEECRKVIMRVKDHEHVSPLDARKLLEQYGKRAVSELDADEAREFIQTLNTMMAD